MRSSICLISFLSLVSALRIFCNGDVSTMLLPRESMSPLRSSRASVTALSSVDSFSTAAFDVSKRSLTLVSFSWTCLYSAAIRSNELDRKSSLLEIRSSESLRSALIVLSCLAHSGSAARIVFSCVRTCSRCDRHSLVLAAGWRLRRGATRSSSARQAAINSGLCSFSMMPLLALSRPWWASALPSPSTPMRRLEPERRFSV
mmetsp:Transcript_4315/g.10976  ORF Transcript_4315/g.10976 Transcript_4315/m.10976 type:complete len:202 (+) Transcript_4315:243-848(+)